MKNALKVLALAFCLTITAIPAFAGEKSTMNSNDYEAIRKVIELYIAAPKKADSAIMKPAFHKDAIMYLVANGKISGGPIQNLYNSVDSAPKAENLQAVIKSITITEDIAFVQLEATNWNGNRYSDMFLLLKGENGWQIITKVFHRHAAGSQG